MAVDMFLKLGDVKGESKDKVHSNEIDVLAWSWGASNTGSAHHGGGAGSGKVNVQDLSFTKFVDKASPDIFLACCDGKHIKEATLVMRKAGEKPLEYLTVKMDQVMITSYSTGGSGGEDRLTENVTLNFAKVSLNYKEQTATGGVGATPSASWDIAANSKD